MVARKRIVLRYTYIACLAYFKASDGEWDLSVEISPFQNVSYKTRRNVQFSTTFYASSWSTVTYSGNTEYTMVLQPSVLAESRLQRFAEQKQLDHYD